MPQAKTPKVSSSQARRASSLCRLCNAQWPHFIQAKTPGAAKKTPASKATPVVTTPKAAPDPTKADPAKADPAKVKSTKSSKAPKK